MHFKVRRRPSGSLVVSLLALFVSLGGVGYATLSLSAGSVGTAQLRNRSVTNRKLANGSVGNSKLALNSVGARKIIPGAVGSAQVHSGAVGSAQIGPGAIGSAQINSTQVQARVTGGCSASHGAINTIASDGSVQCTSTLPQQFATTIPPTVLRPESPGVSTGSLPLGPYLVLANPQFTISGGTVGSTVEVDCTLAPLAGGGPIELGITKSLVVNLGSGIGQNPSIQAAGTIPLALPVLIMKALPGSTTAGVSCSDSATAGSPTVEMSGTINAIQTQSNSS